MPDEQESRGEGQGQQGQGQSEGGQGQGVGQRHTTQSPGYLVRRGLFAEEAVALLQAFYSTGNPTGQCVSQSSLHTLHQI